MLLVVRTSERYIRQRASAVLTWSYYHLQDAETTATGVAAVIAGGDMGLAAAHFWLLLMGWAAGNGATETAATAAAAVSLESKFGADDWRLVLQVLAAEAAVTTNSSSSNSNRWA